MKIKLARKLLGFLLATNFVLPGVVCKNDTFACNVYDIIYVQLKKGAMKEKLQTYYLAAQTIYGTPDYGTPEKIGDNDFFVYLLHSIYQSDELFSEKKRMCELLIKFRDRSEKRCDLGTVFEFLEENQGIKPFGDFAVSLIDPDGQIRAALDGTRFINFIASSEKKHFRKKRRASLKQEMRDKKMRGECDY